MNTDTNPITDPITDKFLKSATPDELLMFMGWMSEWGVYLDIVDELLEQAANSGLLTKLIREYCDDEFCHTADFISHLEEQKEDAAEVVREPTTPNLAVYM